MKYTLDINLNALQAAALCASKEAARPYLKGVNARYKDGEVILESTDGHRAVQIHGAVNQAEPPASVFIPVDLVSKLPKASKKTEKHIVHITVADGFITATMPDGAASTVKVQEVCYPDIDRVKAKDTEAVGVIGLNPDYLADFGKIKKMLGARVPSLKLTFSGGRAPITVEGDLPNKMRFTGLLMPMRV